jgi:hypothetical protein
MLYGVKQGILIWKQNTNLKYLINKNDIHDDIKSRLNSGNDYYCSVQSLLTSRLILKKPED